MPYKQSHPIASSREIIFHLTDSATNTPKLGQTFATTDLQLRKPGASAYTNCNSTQQSAVVEIGGGDYVYTFTAAELDTYGPGFAFKVNKSGALLWAATDEIARAFFATAITGTLTASAFTTDRTETGDRYWNDVLLLALDGANLGQVKEVGSASKGGGYTGATKLFTLATGQLFSSAPSNGDHFEIIDR